MKPQEFAQSATVVFILAGSLHAIRSIMGWEIVIGGWTVPVWISWTAVVVAGYLTFHGLELGKEKQKGGKK